MSVCGDLVYKYVETRIVTKCSERELVQTIEASRCEDSDMVHITQQFHNTRDGVANLFLTVDQLRMILKRMEE